MVDAFLEIDLCKDIFKRKYPKILSVAEDLIYSFNKSKKFKLMVSNSLKVKYNKVIEPSKLDINNCFKKGFFHSKIIKILLVMTINYLYSNIIMQLFVHLFLAFSSISTANLNKLFLYLVEFRCIIKNL